LENRTFAPEINLDRSEQAALAATVATPGYRIIHRIMKAEIDKFYLSFLNAPVGNDDEVLARHKLGKSAAQFYAGVTGRINEEVSQYTSASRANDRPFDETEGILDIGERASVESDLEENSLGEGILDEY
jgi:hypothetical protein